MTAIATTEPIVELENAVKAGPPERRIHISAPFVGLGPARPDATRYHAARRDAARALPLKNSPLAIFGTIPSPIEGIAILTHENMPEPIDHSAARSIVLAPGKSCQLNDFSVHRFAKRREPIPAGAI